MSQRSTTRSQRIAQANPLAAVVSSRSADNDTPLDSRRGEKRSSTTANLDPRENRPVQHPITGPSSDDESTVIRVTGIPRRQARREAEFEDNASDDDRGGHNSESVFDTIAREREAAEARALAVNLIVDAQQAAHDAADQAASDNALPDAAVQAAEGDPPARATTQAGQEAAPTPTAALLEQVFHVDNFGAATAARLGNQGTQLTREQAAVLRTFEENRLAVYRMFPHLNPQFIPTPNMQRQARELQAGTATAPSPRSAPAPATAVREATAAASAAAVEREGQGQQGSSLDSVVQDAPDGTSCRGAFPNELRRRYGWSALPFDEELWERYDDLQAEAQRAWDRQQPGYQQPERIRQSTQQANPTPAARPRELYSLCCN